MNYNDYIDLIKHQFLIIVVEINCKRKLEIESNIFLSSKAHSLKTLRLNGIMVFSFTTRKKLISIPERKLMPALGFFNFQLDLVPDHSLP